MLIYPMSDCAVCLCLFLRFLLFLTLGASPDFVGFSVTSLSPGPSVPPKKQSPCGPSYPPPCNPWPHCSECHLQKGGSQPRTLPCLLPLRRTEAADSYP
uniref:Putative secreted protein n=1 Tax=Ixodes ricinus TaxID=34613 RepID=A0A6B0UE68_IXORI